MTYAEVAAKLDVPYCGGCDDVARDGVRDGRIHWRERRLTRPGLRVFLRLVVQVAHPGWAVLPPWRDLYLTNVEITRLATVVGIRLPRRYADNDRARVRWSLSQHPANAHERRDARCATRWSQRS